MSNHISTARRVAGVRASRFFSCPAEKPSIESLESRVLLSTAESASAQLHLVSKAGTASKPVYNYDITLTNTGTSGIGTFWFAWLPGEDFLPSVPLSEKSPAGWTSFVTGSGNSSDGSAIEWTLGSGGTALAGGKSLSGFDFSSPDSPTALAGKSPVFPSTPVMTSTIYGGSPFSDGGFQFVVAAIPIATQAASTTHLSASASAVTFGASVTLTAKVASAAAGGKTPTGMVTFLDDGTVFGTAIVISNGTAVLTTSSLAIGVNSISAIYGGDSVYQSSISTVVAEIVKMPPVFNPVVAADLAAVDTELLKFRSDLVAASNKLVTDVATIKADDTKQAKTITPLISKVDSDIKTIQTALQADHLTDSALVVADESAVSADEVKVIADKANASLETADKAKLKSARVKLQTDLLAQLTARITLRQTQTNTIATDAKNLLTAIGSGASATPALKAAVTKLTTDMTAAATLLAADLAKLAAERTKLTTDLTSERSS